MNLKIEGQQKSEFYMIMPSGKALIKISILFCQLEKKFSNKEMTLVAGYKQQKL